MATIKNSNPLAKRPIVGVPAKKASLPEVSLPTELSKISHNLEDYHLLIHGEKKIGKTTLSIADGRPFLLTFDPLQKSYSLYQKHCPNWTYFLAYLAKLEEAAKNPKTFPYTRVVVDGADIWYRRCQTYICLQLKIKHPSDSEWGKGWDRLKEDFASAVDRLLALPCGVWFISHSQWREIKTRRSNQKINKLLPLLKTAGEEILVGKIDGWFGYDYDDTERVLTVRGNEQISAGCRIKGHFLTPKGRRVIEIPMGDTEEEGYANLVNAFNNKQWFTTLTERDNHEKKKGGGAKK